MQLIAKNSMNTAANEIISIENPQKEITTCGVSVHGHWQCWGYSSLNGVASVIWYRNYDTCQEPLLSANLNTLVQITIDHLAVWRLFVHIAYLNVRKNFTHFVTENIMAMETQKVFDAVKNIYGKYSVCKLECIGHIQKKNWDTFRKTDQ